MNETQQRAKEAEDAAAEAGVVYRELIQKARHEEQLWRDRIQYWSTWGTVVLVGSNLLLWAVMEPWRRRRIVREIRGEIQSLREERGREEVGLLGEVRRLLTALEQQRVGATEAATVQENEAAAQAAGPEPIFSDISDASTTVSHLGSTTEDRPASLITLISDLSRNPFNQQAVDASLRPLDLTTLVAGAAAAGCLVTGSIAMILVRTM